MKILHIAPYLTINSKPEFTRNKTGFGYMVYDIARSVGEMAEVEVVASDVRYKEFGQGGVRFLGVSYGEMLRNLFRCVPLGVLFSLLKKYKMPRGAALRLVYYWLLSGYISRVITEGRYDIVHVHGCGFFTEIWMQVCRRLGQKFIVTLHGLNSFSDTVSLNAAGKQYERDFLQRVANGEIPITVISSGMKHIIEKTFGMKDCANIKVVCNSFSFGECLSSGKKRTGSTIRELNNIPPGGKILLYVGNISVRKNQQQMVDAYALLPDHIRKNTWVLFCGRPSQDGSFERAVKESPFENHLVLCGIVKKEAIAAYYKEADGVVLLSIAEGFGLSLIEGMHFGVPCAMFTDMDAFEDIYDSCAVVPIADRDNAAVASAIGKLLETSWDKATIKSYSQKFENGAMAHNYIDVYTKLKQNELL